MIQSHDKYELLNETKVVTLGDPKSTPIVVHRIRAVRDIPFYGVVKGELGGFVESYKNLSQTDSCWIAHNAVVAGDVKVIENALVTDDSFLFGDAVLSGHARVSDSALVKGGAHLSGNVIVVEKAKIYGAPTINGSCVIREKAVVCGEPRIGGHVVLGGTCRVFGDKLRLDGNVRVGGDSGITGDLTIDGNECFFDATVEKVEDFCTIDRVLFAVNGTLTYCRNRDTLATYSWHGTPEEFRKVMKERLTETDIHEILYYVGAEKGTFLDSVKAWRHFLFGKTYKAVSCPVSNETTAEPE